MDCGGLWMGWRERWAFEDREGSWSCGDGRRETASGEILGSLKLLQDEGAGGMRRPLGVAIARRERGFAVRGAPQVRFGA